MNWCRIMNEADPITNPSAHKKEKQHKKGKVQLAIEKWTQNHRRKVLLKNYGVSGRKYSFFSF